MSFERGRHISARADQTTVRHANLGVVLQHVSRQGPCSRARIAEETGLTRGTVSSLVSELLDLDLLRETGEDERPGRVGRPAQTLELGRVVVAIGLEINVDYLAACIEDMAGSVLYEKRVYVDNRRASPGPVLLRLARMARQAIEAAERDGHRVAGIAVAVPGLVDVRSGTLLRAPNLDWSEIMVADALRARIGSLPVRVENEANLAALAEHSQGAAQGLGSFICVFGEVGVGAGIFVDGVLFRGAHGFGGEFGHLTLDPAGETCACGSRGCLETFVGQEVIARRAGVEIEAGGRTQSVTDELVRRANGGDGRTLDSLREVGRLLGIGLASAVNLFDVDAIVLGGCFGPLAPWLEGEIRAVLDERVLAARWSACELRASELGETAAVRGAAALTLSAVIAEPWTVARRGDDAQEAVS